MICVLCGSDEMPQNMTGDICNRCKILQDRIRSYAADNKLAVVSSILAKVKHEEDMTRRKLIHAIGEFLSTKVGVFARLSANTKDAIAKTIAYHWDELMLVVKGEEVDSNDN